MCTSAGIFPAKGGELLNVHQQIGFAGFPVSQAVAKWVYKRTVTIQPESIYAICNYSA